MVEAGKVEGFRPTLPQRLFVAVAQLISLPARSDGTAPQLQLHGGTPGFMVNITKARQATSPRPTLKEQPVTAGGKWGLKFPKTIQTVQHN